MFYFDFKLIRNVNHDSGNLLGPHYSIPGAYELPGSGLWDIHMMKLIL